MGTRIALCVLLAAALAAPSLQGQDDGLTESPDGPEAVTVYYTPDEALAKVFAGADSVWSEIWRPADAEITALQQRLGWEVPAADLTVHRARRDDRDLGYAVITEERGRFKPITFIVHADDDLRVANVLVMVYRESRGDGVKRQRFLKQFRRKGAADPLRLNRDIVGVSGATMSSRGIAAGVKRVLASLELAYGEPAP
jgi:hypothetical protein